MLLVFLIKFEKYSCCFRDGQTPLHLACAWGMELVVQCLMEHAADVNTQVDVLSYIHHNHFITLVFGSKLAIQTVLYRE